MFTEVKTFLKRRPYENTTYLTLVTEQGSHVTMSENHIIFVSSTNKSADMESRYLCHEVRGGGGGGGGEGGRVCDNTNVII